MKYTSFLFLLFVPLFAFAGPDPTWVNTLTGEILGVVNAIIPALISLAVAVFFFGVAKFITRSGDERAVQEGKQLMVWGVIALFAIVSVWGLVALLQEVSGIGFGSPLESASVSY